jgi:hypothetical protein
MNATPVAAAPQLTAEQWGDRHERLISQLSAEQWIERTQKALELMHLTDTIGELLESPPQIRNNRLIAWYRAKRALVAAELDL